MLVVAHLLAFAQNLRRYTVGYDGAIQYWLHPQWSPPLSPLLLTVAYALVLTAFVGWVLGAAGRSAKVRATAEAERRGSELRTAPGTT
jgi:hypothetical protein